MSKSIVLSKSIHNAEIERLRRLIWFMGGRVYEEISENIHYFITENVWSVEEAKECGVDQIMQTNWITKLWEINQGDNDITHQEYKDIETLYRVPIFFNLTFSVTGVKNVLEIQSCIERNKGFFSKNFNKKVDILIVDASARDNDKHRIATAWKKLTVSEKWLCESIQNGYALNIKNRENRESFILKSSGPPPYNLIMNSTDRSPTDLTTDFGCDLSRVSDSANNTDSSVRSMMSTRHSVRDSSVVDNSKRSTKSEFAIPKPKPKVDSKTLVAYKSKVIEKFLKEKTVFVCKRDDFILSKALECGATLLEDKDEEEVDYVIIVGLFKPKLNLKFKKIGHMVNHYWLSDCIASDKLVKIETHHQPFDIVEIEKKPLKNEIFVVSNYKDTKRSFVKTLVERLGGVCRESLVKSESPIIICPTAEGTKYQSAISWNLTCLTFEWLVECYQNQFRANEEGQGFLVGLSKTSKNNIERNLKRASLIPSSPEKAEFNSNFSRQTCHVDSVSDRIGLEKRNAISLNSKSPCKSTEQKIREILTSMPTPERAIASRLLRDSSKTNTKANGFAKTDEENVNNFSKIRLRPCESPGTTERHSMKLASMDKICVASINDTKSNKKPELEESEEPSFEIRRYLFYKSRIPGYSSPDPRSYRNLKFATNGKNAEEITKTPDFENQENSIDPSNFFAIRSDNIMQEDEEEKLNFSD